MCHIRRWIFWPAEWLLASQGHSFIDFGACVRICLFSHPVRILSLPTAYAGLNAVKNVFSTKYGVTIRPFWSSSLYCRELQLHLKIQSAVEFYNPRPVPCSWLELAVLSDTTQPWRFCLSCTETFSSHEDLLKAPQYAIQWLPGPSFPGVKRPARGVDRPPLSSAEVKE